MILDRIGLIRTLFFRKSEAAEAGVRWRRAARAEPELMGDVIRLGGILSIQPDDFQFGVPQGAPIDPIRLAYEAGRADLARQLCALMGLNRTELQSLMEDDE
jgi:hypothetical protein